VGREPFHRIIIIKERPRDGHIAKKLVGPACDVQCA
jgi:hypothetical protein